MTGQPPIRVLCVDYHVLLREGIVMRGSFIRL